MIKWRKTMRITEKDLANQCELIQNDLMCVLDGLDKQMLDDVCQVVVDRIKILKKRLLEPNQHYVQILGRGTMIDQCINKKS